MFVTSGPQVLDGNVVPYRFSDLQTSAEAAAL
jgi:hypothetical protein